MRVAKPITLSAKERATLTKWSRGRSTPARLVQRAKIILAAAEGRQNKDIAAELGCTKRTVGIWRNRFAAEGIAGIEKDAPRPGRRAVVREKKGSGDHSQDDPGDSSSRDTVECENHGEGDGCQQRHGEARLA